MVRRCCAALWTDGRGRAALGGGEGQLLCDCHAQSYRRVSWFTRQREGGHTVHTAVDSQRKIKFNESSTFSSFPLFVHPLCIISNPFILIRKTTRPNYTTSRSETLIGSFVTFWFTTLCSLSLCLVRSAVVTIARLIQKMHLQMNTLLQFNLLTSSVGFCYFPGCYINDKQAGWRLCVPAPAEFPSTCDLPLFTWRYIYSWPPPPQMAESLPQRLSLTVMSCLPGARGELTDVQQE